MPEDKFKPLLAAAFTTLVWASAFAAIRAGLDGFGWGPLALLRFSVACAVLVTYAAATGIRLPARGDLPKLALAGVLGIDVYHLGLNFGETQVEAGPASLLIAAVPIVTVALAWIVLKERVRPLEWAGIAVGFVGVALISLSASGGFRFEPASLAIVAAAIGESGYFIIIKPMMRRYSPMAITVYTFVAGWLFMLPFAPALLRELPAAPPATIASVVYLGVFPAAIAYLAWNFALSRLPTGPVMSFLYLSPALAILIAWVWLREVPSLLSLLGGTIVTVGVVIVNSGGKPGPESLEKL